ncbi:MAG: metal-dependent hydrolase [Polyangiaceae bacterium]|nr:metal-dependent hydrolase [Polyangiaceae bacterium]
MSDSRTHRRVGATAGAVTALCRAQSADPLHVLLEVIGGAVGGRTPDPIDVSNIPRHRGIAHGVVPVTVAGVGFGRTLGDAQQRMRAEAARRAELRRVATTALERLWHALIELVCRLGAGALAGFLPGYGSHLALDAFTPAGLPLSA